MDKYTVTDVHGIFITCEGHSAAIQDVQGEPGHMATIIFDEVVWEELQAMGRMAAHMVADMPGDRAYTVAVFLANLFGGEAREFTLPFDVSMPDTAETRQ